MPEAPRLSVLIPVWNGAETVERAIHSVLTGATIPLECVVIDDGSTDGTPDVVEAIAKRDPRVVLLRIPKNAGVSNARNRGVEVARADWLSFLDADDLLLPGAVSAMLRPTADPAVRVVIGQRYWTDGERTWLSKYYDIPDITEPGRKSIASHPGLLYYASSTGKVIHRSLIGGLRFEGRVLGDQPWTIRAMLRAGSGIEVVGDVVYEWWRPPEGDAALTIGTSTQASAERAAVMASRAPAVHAEVSAEVDAVFADRATRLAIKTAYLDRLVRADIGYPVRQTLDRADPASAILYTAVGRFFESVPRDVLGRSDIVITSLVRPVLLRWNAIIPPARPSYLRMIRPVLLAKPGLDRALSGRKRSPAFALTRWLGHPIGTWLGSRWITAVESLEQRRRSRPR